ncbi:clathrin heavy chain [Cryptosporidium canis]|uniref:Clathrin heavy chain n=1 Tax=Cryptosporidium canis TaxID=195482 RepID=A0ABQ8P6H0_9CRYT|nr:clathrin heavy chain [Cryptosporidium canis]
MQNKGGIPITTNVLANLEELGINPSCFRFGSLTLEGDKYVGVKETSVDGGSQIVVIDTQSKGVNRKPMKAESALIHPIENILVVRGRYEENGCTVQIFNLDSKEKLGAFFFPEPVVFWKWLTPRILAIVGDKGVYHWTIESGSPNSIPVRIFERAGSLAEQSTQIVGYQTDSTQRWCLLMGLCPVTNESTGSISVKGQLQLFSVEKRQQQLIEGFSGNFGELVVDDFAHSPASVVCFVEKKHENPNARLHVMDISGQRSGSSELGASMAPSTPFKAVIDLPSLDAGSPGGSQGFDFPIYTFVSSYFGVIFIITRGGVLYIVEPTSNTLLYCNRVCQDSVFLGSPSRFHGICMANKRGLVLHITLNSSAVLSYIQSSPELSHDSNLLRWAQRYGYQGTDEFSVRMFNETVKRQDYQNACRIVSLNKNGSLRTPATLNHFKMIDSSHRLLFQYFTTVYKFHTLNQFESTEFCRLLLSPSSGGLISEFTSITQPLVFLQTLINEDKLTFSEEFGDALLQNGEKKLALKIFSKCTPQNPTKILQTLIEIGNFSQVSEFIREQKASNWPTITTDIRSLLNSLLIAGNIDATVEFVKAVLLPPVTTSQSDISGSGSAADPLDLNIDKPSIVEIFVSHSRFKEITSILLDHLKANKPEDSVLQTKLLEVNLLHAPQVAEALFQMDLFTHYDKQTVAALCEKAGLYERALENFSDMRDIRRILGVACGSLNTDWLANYLSKLSPRTRFDCLKELLLVCKSNGGIVSMANSGMSTSSNGAIMGTGQTSVPIVNSTSNSIALSNNNTALQNVIQVCIKNMDNIGIENIITLFEQQGIWEGIYYVISSNLTQYLSGNSLSTSGSSESLSLAGDDFIGESGIQGKGAGIVAAGSGRLPSSNSASVGGGAGSQSTFIVFKYIEASIHLGQIQEAERICRDFPQSYDPDQVIEYFKSIKMSDLRPLIWVCDLHHRVEELVSYLYHMSLYKYIQVYTLKINPSQTPLVIGTLIDLDGSEDLVKSLLQEIKTLGSSFSFSELIQQAENRNRLKLLLSWLEERVQEGYQDPALHNALAKIYIDMNKDSENFLKTNPHYDAKTIGDYCEDRDPYLAYIAYRKAWGQCDDEIIQVTYKNDLYRLLARYLVERQDLDLWNKVLGSPSSPSEQPVISEQCRQAIIDQVTSSILPEFYNKPEEISCVIRAFINAEVPGSLLEVLEKIIFHVNNTEFSQNKNLQNLLLLTSIKIDVRRLDDYLLRLDNYDAKEVAKVATEHGLYSQAFQIYKKFSFNNEAVETLLMISKIDLLKSQGVNVEALQAGGEGLGDLDSMIDVESLAKMDLSKVQDFASYCNDNSVWDVLGQQYLKISRTKDAVDCFIKSENTRDYRLIIEHCLSVKAYQDLLGYLQMVRRLKDSRTSKDPIVDTELAYCMSKLKLLEELQSFLQGINTVQLQKIGDRLMEEQDYRYSIIFYQAIPNYSRLTSCYIHLEEYNNALETAKKANSPKTWKELLQICMQIGESGLAHQAGLNIIVYPDYCEDVVSEYEKKGLTSELLTLLEGAIQNTDRANGSLFTELGILYAKYTPEKLMDYCASYSGRINIPKLTRICEQRQLWNEVVYLYLQYQEFDQAVLTVISHPKEAWKNEQFLNILQNVSNVDILYKSMTFYLYEHPELLNSLLMLTLKPKKKSEIPKSNSSDISDYSPSRSTNGALTNQGTGGSTNKFDLANITTRFIQQYFSSGISSFGDSGRGTSVTSGGISTVPSTGTPSSHDISIIQEFLESISEENIQVVNEALINLYIEKMEVEKLMKLILTCDNYDQANLSARLEKHPVNELRKLAVKILDKNSNYQQALSICQKEMLIDEAILVVYKSGNVALIEDLLEFLLSNNKKENFVACLYTCYEFLRPDTVMEMAWKHNCLDATMPFFIQSLRDMTNRIDVLEKKLETLQITDIATTASGGHPSVSNSQNISSCVEMGANTSISPGIIGSHHAPPGNAHTSNADTLNNNQRLIHNNQLIFH